MFYYVLFASIFAGLVWYAISFTVKPDQKAKNIHSMPRWKISNHIGVLSTSSKSVKKKEEEEQYPSSTNSNYNVKSNIVDKYATPWNNAPLGMKTENEPDTAELFRRLDSDFKRVARPSSTKSSARRRPIATFVATPASIEKNNPYVQENFAKYNF
jgi:hypothetical protein